MALRRRQSAQFNFQIRKNEIDPEPLSACPEFHTQLQQRFCPKLRQWLSSVRPYTVHCSVQGFLQVAPPPPLHTCHKTHFLLIPNTHTLSTLPTYCQCIYSAYVSTPIYSLYASPAFLPAYVSCLQGTAGGGVGLLARGVRGAPAWSVLVVVGELRGLKDAQDVRWMCHALGWPCLCDSLGTRACPHPHPHPHPFFF